MQTPDEYDRATINLGSRYPSSTAALNYDRAVIFFTPKIADRGIDLAGMECEMVQIVNRGEWGTEEINFTIPPSSPTNRRWREYYLTQDCIDFTLKFIPPVGLRMGIIELYLANNEFNPNNMPTSNPGDPVDVTALANAIGNNVGAAISAQNPNLAAQMGEATAAALNRAQQTRSVPNVLTASPWSGDIKNHEIAPEDSKRLKIKLFHTGTTNGTNNSNSEVSIVVGDPSGKGNKIRDHYLAPKGNYESSDEEDISIVYAWVNANQNPALLSATEVFPA
jgi:hypothetical protein